MNRFKVGDEVTVVKVRPLISPSTDEKEKCLGKSFIIYAEDQDMWPYMLSQNHNFWFSEEEVELSLVAGSPLYEALK